VLKAHETAELLAAYALTLERIAVAAAVDTAAAQVRIPRLRVDIAARRDRADGGARSSPV
jgi:hypothetical protein